MSDSLLGYLGLRLQAEFEKLVASVAPTNNGVSHTFGKMSNDALPLRAYVAFIKSSDGDEIAVTVDVLYKKNGWWVIQSDLCTGEGSIIAEGPSITIQKMDEEIMMKWFGEFETFLVSNYEVIKFQISKLE